MRRLLRRGSGTTGPRPPAYDVPAPPPPGVLPSVAVLTMARDEGHMLQRWVSHYAREVGAANVVVIDDNSSDGSTDALPCPVLKIPPLRKRGFERSRMEMLAGVSAGLLEAYDAVLACDADEFLVADPDRHESLRHFVAARPGHRALAPVALNVVHDHEREPPLKDEQPILDQRRLAKFVPLMCKPGLKWVPARWVAASHGIECPFEVDPELFMFHMKFADLDHLAAVAARRHHLNQTEGRAKNTSWDRSGDEMSDLLRETMTGAAEAKVRPFRPTPQRLAGIVEESAPGVWRATGEGQVRAMRNRPLVRIPKRFRGLV